MLREAERTSGDEWRRRESNPRQISIRLEVRLATNWRTWLGVAEPDFDRLADSEKGPAEPEPSCVGSVVRGG
jgi:hypothetical protein